VSKIDGKFKPTFLGSILVEKLLSPAFDDILDVNYTRELEEGSTRSSPARPPT
jgi:hypothetical protein